MPPSTSSNTPTRKAIGPTTSRTSRSGVPWSSGATPSWAATASPKCAPEQLRRSVVGGHGTRGRDLVEDPRRDRGAAIGREVVPVDRAEADAVDDLRAGRPARAHLGREID